MKHRVLAVLVCALAGTAGAQTGPITNDPNALPQGPDAPRRADTQSQGVAARAAARSECRRIEDRQQRRDCERSAQRDFDEDKARKSPMPNRPGLPAQ